MEVVLDELRENDVDIDVSTLSYHIRHCLEQYKTMYEQMAVRVGPLELPGIFNDIFECEQFWSCCGLSDTGLCAGHP